MYYTKHRHTKNKMLLNNKINDKKVTLINEETEHQHNTQIINIVFF